MKNKIPKVHLEDLHPPVWEVNLATDGAVGVERPELARGGAGVAQTYRGVDGVALPGPLAHVELRGGNGFRKIFR